MEEDSQGLGLGRRSSSLSFPETVLLGQRVHKTFQVLLGEPEEKASLIAHWAPKSRIHSEINDQGVWDICILFHFLLGVYFREGVIDDYLWFCHFFYLLCSRYFSIHLCSCVLWKHSCWQAQIHHPYPPIWPAILFSDTDNFSIMNFVWKLLHSGAFLEWGVFL